MTSFRYSKTDDTYPQQVIRRAQAGGAFALVQVRSDSEARQYPVFVVATHDNAAAAELMYLGGWISDGDGDLRPPESAAEDVEYHGDILEHLSYQEWRDLMLEYGGGVYVGRLGRTYFHKVVDAEASLPDELEVESWEGTLYRFSDANNIAQCIAELRPLESIGRQDKS